MRDIKDADGNTLTLHEVVSASPPLAIAETLINPTCSGLANGSIELEVSGGTGAYFFQWDNGVSTQNQSNLISGLYSVTVTDSLGCSAQKTFMLSNGTTLAAEAILTPPNCQNTGGAMT